MASGFRFREMASLVQNWGAAVIVLLCLLGRGAFGQSIDGKYAAVDRILDNGEVHKTIIELKQSGDRLTGKISTFEFSEDIEGAISGTHIDLEYPWNHTKGFLSGDLVGRDLHLVQGSNHFVAVPAGPQDLVPDIRAARASRFGLPALHDVPDNGLARTPPMGWNSWNLFGSKVDDPTVRRMADAMVATGMRDIGYVFVVIDDTWQGVRDDKGVLQPNHKFPDMKSLADYVHSKGLKLGIYSSPGPRTCGGYPGSYGHESQDASTWADWGIDYVKYDWCSAYYLYGPNEMQAVFQKMGDALRATQRPMVYSLSEYSKNVEKQKWASRTGANLWRTTPDIRADWNSVVSNIEAQEQTAPYAHPGHWNDPDMLEVGNGRMTEDEYRSHMSLWCLASAPLLAGNDLRNMKTGVIDILLNREVIAIDQDPLGDQGKIIFRNGKVETWRKALDDGGFAVGVFNRGDTPVTVRIQAKLFGNGKTPTAMDLWLHKPIKFRHGHYTATISAHGIALLRTLRSPLQSGSQ